MVLREFLYVPVILLSFVQIIWGFSLTSKLRQCCQDEACLSTPKYLLNCIDKFLPSYDEAILRAVHNASQSKPTFLVHQYMTSNLHNYGAFSFACVAFYCAKHNYGLTLFGEQHIQIRSTDKNILLPYDDLDDPQRDQRWSKIWLLHQSVTRLLRASDVTETKSEFHNGGCNSGDCFVVWMDSDLIVLDLNLRLEHFAMSFPYADLIVSRDFLPEHGLINSGFMIFRASAWSLRFLNDWWQSFSRAELSDQAAFSKLYARLRDSERVVLLEPEALNSKFPAWYELESSDMVLHLAGTHDALRADIFAQAWRTICSDDGFDPPQLGLNRAALLATVMRMREKMANTALQVVRTTPECAVTLETVQDVSDTMHTALQLGYAARQRQWEASAAGIGMCQGAFYQQEVMRATATLRWVSHCFAQRAAGPHEHAAAAVQAAQREVEADFQLLDHLQTLPPDLRIAIATEEQAESLPSASETMLSATTCHASGDALSTAPEAFTHLFLTVLARIERRVEELKVFLAQSFPVHSKLRATVAYYAYKVSEGRSALAEAQNDATARRLALRRAVAQLEILKNEEQEGQDSELPAHVHEEAALALLALAELECDPTDQGSEQLSHFESPSSNLPPEVTESNALGPNLRMGIAQAKRGHALLKQVWRDRVLPKRIEQLLHKARRLEIMCEQRAAYEKEKYEV